jgi:eukaryotic-like serine/threonine-protein kinase
MLTGLQLGKYEITAKLGEGGMGEVYSAYDTELGRKVAVKLLPNEFNTDAERRDRFRQEARVVSALNHPNIITIFEIGDDDENCFLVTEFVDGRTLREVIKHDSMTLARVLRIIEQAANALVAAHAAGIVHRDIKPENIMVRRDSIVKVLDFGLAKANQETTAASDPSNYKTIPGTVLGSARYMSPEQARGREVDERTDIWSLGVVLYEMLTGRVPFSGETTTDTLAAVIYKEPEPVSLMLPNVPAELQRILRKSLQKDREERYQSVKDLALDVKDLLYALEHASSGERSGHVTSSPNFSENPTILHTISGRQMTSAAEAAASFREPSRRSRVRPWLVAALPVLALLLLALGVMAVFYSGGAEPMAANAFARPQISRINTDGKVVLPALSPDGKYVAYVNGEIGNQSLVVRQISNDSIITIVPPTNLGFSAVAFSPKGDWIYYCQTRSDFAVNTLFKVPTLGGRPTRLIEDVDSAVTFSPDEKRFAFMRHTSTGSEDIMFTADSASLEMEEVIRSKQAGFDFFSSRPSWSPDGKRILVGAGKREGGFVSSMTIGEIDLERKAFHPLEAGKFFSVGSFVWFADGSGFLCAGRETQNGPVQVWRSSYPSIDLQPVTNDFNDYAEVGLAADGSTILTIKGETNSSLWRFSPATRSITPITHEGRSVYGIAGLSQAADGTVFFTSKEGKEYRLWKTDREGKTPSELLKEPGSSVVPTVSRDGRYVVFVRQRDRTSRIWRMNPDGTGAVQLTEQNEGHFDFNPQVSPDGKLVVFQRQLPNEDRSILMRMPIDGGSAEVLYDSEGWSVFTPRISPDGKQIAFGTYDMKSFEKRLRIASLDDYKFGRIERDMEFNLIAHFTWSPDGKGLTILTTRDGTPNIYKLPIDGGPAVPLTNFRSGRIFNFAWSADGKDLLLARGTTVNDLLLIRDNERAAETSAVAAAPGPQRRVRSFLERLTGVFTQVRR